MKHFLLAVVVVGLMAGCNTTEPEDMYLTTPVITLAEQAVVRGIVEEWVRQGKPLQINGDDDAPSFWRTPGHHRLEPLPADDDAPNKGAGGRVGVQCGAQGPPRCQTVASGMDKCIDACGDRFYVVEYEPGEHICVNSYGGYVYTCSGFGM